MSRILCNIWSELVLKLEFLGSGLQLCTRILLRLHELPLRGRGGSLVDLQLLRFLYCNLGECGVLLVLSSSFRWGAFGSVSMGK